jgi:hypothetical protein
MGLHVDILQKLVCEVHFAGTSPKDFMGGVGLEGGETCPRVHFCGEFLHFSAQKISSFTPIRTRQLTGQPTLSIKFEMSSGGAKLNYFILMRLFSAEK